jgi:hypothetical protein
VIVEPLVRQRRRRWALVTPGWHTLLVEGPEVSEAKDGPIAVSELLGRCSKLVLYCRGSLAAFRDTTHPTEWEGDTWRGRVIRIRHRPTGASIVTLRDALEEASDPVDELAMFIDALDARGVSPSGFGGMGFALWRSTLRDVVRLDADPSVGRAALYGSRQSAPVPRRYKFMRAVDIRRAYPHAMGARPYALHLREVARTTSLDGEVAGIARARVYVDGDCAIPPLPVRVAPGAIQFQRGIVEGTWAWCELAAAASVGFRVDVIRSWAPSASADLFGERWQSLVDALTSLPGAAGRLGKATVNTTWGTFGMRGDDRGMVTWEDRDHPLHVRLGSRPLPHVRTAHVAAETAARLRARVLTEALYGPVATAVHVDTDGIVVRATSPLPSPHGDGPGEWRDKGTYRIVDVKAPQVWRGLCASCTVDHPPWHYCVAGVAASQAERVFRRMPAGMRCGVRGLDTVLPSGHAQDPGRISIEVDRARAAEVAMFGPGLLD